MSPDDSKRGTEREAALSRDAFLADAYFTPEQLWSFAEQIYHLHRAAPRRLIEVGVGNGFVSQFMRSMGINVLTCDINPNLNPDLLVSVTDLDRHITPGEYDLISCCEVMEHMPFEQFEEAMRKFSCLSENLFLTLPVYGWKFGFALRLSLKSRVRWISRWFAWRSSSYTLIPMHYWEVGSQRETQHRRLLSVLNRYYGSVESNIFRFNPYHRYYLCRGAKSVS